MSHCQRRRRHPIREISTAVLLSFIACILGVACIAPNSVDAFFQQPYHVGRHFVRPTFHFSTNYKPDQTRILHHGARRIVPPVLTASRTPEETKKKANRTDNWGLTFERLLAYYQSHGHVNVPIEYNDGQLPRLGYWVLKQRRDYKKGHIPSYRVEALESVGFQWKRSMQQAYDETWMNYFNQLKTFSEKYNTTKIASAPRGCNDKFAVLVNWMNCQKRLYNAFVANKTSQITQERIDMLNSINFAWSLQNRTDHEEWMYQYFQLYWHHWQYNNTNITTSSGHNGAFVRWVSRQKEAYHDGTLDQGKIDVLEELGFDWTLDPPATWDELFQELVQYHERFGSTLLNKNINTELAVWTQELRLLHNKGDLDPKWVAKLNSLGFQWEVEDVDWNAMFDRLVAYKEKNGNVLVSRICAEDPPLGRWVSNLRQRCGKFLKGCEKIDKHKISEVAKATASTKMSAESHLSRLSKLVKIGFEFDPFEAQWLEMYELLLGYKREYGSVNVPVSLPKLGIWVSNQRSESKITQRRKDLLDEAGFEWDPLEANWQEMFESLCKYKLQFGNANVPAKYPELGLWVINQRRAYKRGELKHDRMIQLESIGFVWSIKS
jgi:Helicase associated domain